MLKLPLLRSLFTYLFFFPQERDYQWRAVLINFQSTARKPKALADNGAIPRAPAVAQRDWQHLGSAGTWVRFPAQEVEDLVLPQLPLSSWLQLGSDPWLGSSMYHAAVPPPKKKDCNSLRSAVSHGLLEQLPWFLWTQNLPVVPA